MIIIQWEGCMAVYRTLHDWGMTAKEAVVLQRELASQVRVEAPKGELGTIAGLDISFNLYSTTMYAGVVVLDCGTMEVVEERVAVSETEFPYVPGLLSFREIPPLLEVWKKLVVEPDVVMVDGHGIAHPRRFGIACHFGLHVMRPTFGCGKRVLTGVHEEPGRERGSGVPLTDGGETIGVALRTKRNVKPVYPNPGHLIDLETAVKLVLACDGGYRIPEPTRRAHNLVNACRRGEREVD